MNTQYKSEHNIIDVKENREWVSPSRRAPLLNQRRGSTYAMSSEAPSPRIKAGRNSQQASKRASRFWPQ